MSIANLIRALLKVIRICFPLKSWWWTWNIIIAPWFLIANSTLNIFELQTTRKSIHLSHPSAWSWELVSLVRNAVCRPSTLPRVERVRWSHSLDPAWRPDAGSVFWRIGKLTWKDWYLPHTWKRNEAGIKTDTFPCNWFSFTELF